VSEKPVINNAFYDDLGERWYTASDDPVALLRAESRLRVPWVVEKISRDGAEACVLDVACGAGFLSNALALKNHQVTGIDLSVQSLAVAEKYDTTKSVTYLAMDAHHLDFPDASFDVVCAMDFLEHVSDRNQVIKEFSRVLKPGGRFFFHTFNRNFLSWLIVIKGVEWFVKNTPDHMHTYDAKSLVQAFFEAPRGTSRFIRFSICFHIINDYGLRRNRQKNGVLKCVTIHSRWLRSSFSTSFIISANTTSLKRPILPRHSL
jgi:2-polyprenyl-6-hydroxyphenyl methylase/3-demethylubiquinone-9 3-methyltransferase